jgi:hypothetical protein
MTETPAVAETWDWSDHWPSGYDDMTGYGQVSCCCGWDSSDEKPDWVEHIKAMLPPTLDAAWAAAEAALPEGWWIDAVRRRTTYHRFTGGGYQNTVLWTVDVASPLPDLSGEERGEYTIHAGPAAPTPAAALLSLADALRARGVSGVEG